MARRRLLLARYAKEILAYEAAEDPYAQELCCLRLIEGEELGLPCPGCAGNLLPDHIWPCGCSCGGRGFVLGIGRRKV